MRQRDLKLYRYLRALQPRGLARGGIFFLFGSNAPSARLDHHIYYAVAFAQAQKHVCALDRLAEHHVVAV